MRELVADDLEIGDRLAELHALLRVLERRLVRRLRGADRARRRLDARVLVGRHQLIKAAALFAAEEVLARAAR